MRALLITSVVALLLAACEEPAGTGTAEPVRARAAVFKRGALPGQPAAAFDADASFDEADGPRVTYLSTQSRVVRPGQAGFSISGRTSGGAYAIALRLEGVGSGYWLKPVANEDPAAPGELTWSTALDFGADVPPGTQVLQLVAFDENGVAGSQNTLELCVTRDIEHSLNACDATVKPPAAIIALRWSADADVDLVVKTPSGVIVDATHPATQLTEDGEVDSEAPGVGLLQLDSNPSCDLDSARIETLSFAHSPEPGTYEVYANLFEACGRTSVALEVSAYARARASDEGGEDAFRIVAIGEPVRAVLLGSSANGGVTNGLYVTSYQFP